MPARPPEPNPFPRNTVVTNSLDRVPTYPSVAFTEAQTKLLEATRRFGIEPNSLGAAIGLRGRFGSGKSHACLWLKQSFEQAQKMGKSIYVKISTSDRLEIYKNYIGQNLTPEDFKRIVSSHILVALRRRTGEKDTLAELAEKELRSRIETEPELGIQFLREDLLPVTGLLETVQGDAEGATRALAADLSTAYSHISHPLVGKLAIQWLQGNTLQLGEMRDLGVSLPGISKPGEASLALRFLLETFRRAEVPFFLCLDEHERVTVRSSEQDIQASLGVLKDLAELFVTSGHVLLVSGISDAWDKLPEDVYARIRRDDIIEIRLDRSEAPKLLRSWVPDLDKVFVPEALERLYDASQNNNARRLLDLAHQAWQAWSSNRRTPLQPDAVRDITRSALGDRNRKVSLADAIEQCAASLSLGLERDAEFRGVHFDFVLSGAERRRILVQVSESAFLLDEIDHGREIVTAQKQLAAEHNRIRTCTVMIGYSSFEVRDALERAVDRVLIYDEVTFPSQFQEFVSRSIEDMSAAFPPVPVPEIAQATRILDSEEAKRAEHVQRVSSALDVASAPQQQRQEGTLSRQADEQMAAILQEIRDILNSESEHLIRLTDGIRPSIVEDILKGVSFIIAQQECLRRARNLTERETGGSSVTRIFEALRQELARAEEVWQSVTKETGIIDRFQLDRIRNSIVRRRTMLHDGEQNWLRRHRRRWFFTDPFVVAPAAVAISLLVWFGLDYEQSLSARQQAFTAFRQSLNGLIGFAIGYPATSTSEKSFTDLVIPLEQALLNPALPSSIRTSDLHHAIATVRFYYEHGDSPSQTSINDLRSSATDVLRSAYPKVSDFTSEYATSHFKSLTIIGLLLIWCIIWPYVRLWLPRLRR